VGDGLAEILELDPKQTSVNGGSAAISSRGQSWVATLVNLLTVPLGYGYISNLMDIKDRYVEIITASRQLRKRGYIVRSNEIYYPKEIRIDGGVVDRKEQLVGRLLFDGLCNRAEILWEHHPKVERKLRDSGYVSVAPVDKS